MEAKILFTGGGELVFPRTHNLSLHRALSTINKFFVTPDISLQSFSSAISRDVLNFKSGNAIVNNYVFTSNYAGKHVCASRRKEAREKCENSNKVRRKERRNLIHEL
ncbi:hypothetical protein PUN28_017148 [Cardiocondyla obscurior]|uniref:Uncharacterized protein n=1 Tax=Cardiocondyla obscurior TaxID=286306 RepID=A0AAW2EMN8_9HYME